MTIKEQLLNILNEGRASELEFFSHLTDDDRTYEGTYEKWSAKDCVSHSLYWEDVRSMQGMRFIRGEEQVQIPRQIPRGEQANADSYEQFSKKTWDEVETFAEQVHSKMVETVQGMDEATLSGPWVEAEERKMWEVLEGAAFSHKLGHFAQFYTERNRMEEASQLWKEWADLVSPLDESPEWQGRVRYNAACGLALAGDSLGALEELRIALTQRPGLKAWSRLDSDLENLHDLQEFKEFFAPSYWWEALDSDPQAEVVADQFLRALGMFRAAVNTFPKDSWVEGDTNYQRPAGLALHITQSINFYSALKLGERSEEPLTQINWQNPDSDKLPSQAELLRFLDYVEEKVANFIVKADFEAKETMFPWTGSTVLSRALFSLRHMQHHLADMIMELQRRGLRPPDFQ
jgi:tetratricopeptide (TPR) repeat protein